MTRMRQLPAVDTLTAARASLRLNSPRMAGDVMGYEVRRRAFLRRARPPAACGGVPGHGQRLAGELERDCAADRVRGAVAGLAGPEFLLGVLDRDLNCPAGGIALDDLRPCGVQSGGEP